MNLLNKAFLALALPITLIGCSATPDAQVRDLRPLQIERGDKVTVETSTPLLVIGAPTTVTFDRLLVGGTPLTINARAVTATRALFDADETLARTIGGHLIDAPTTITLTQTVDGKAYPYHSSPSDPFPLDLFPRSLRKMADDVSLKVTGGTLWTWLGTTVKDGTGGVAVESVVARVNKEEIFRKWDTPPINGRITKEEAHVGQPGGMPAEEFARYDINHDGNLDEWELEEQPQDDGIAAAAGLRAGDLIVAANGKPVTTVSALGAVWNTDSASVDLTVKRGAANATIGLPRYGKPLEIPAWLIWAIVMGLAAGIVALPVPVIGGLIVVWERKISAYMQSRIGPNRVGPGGWLQWLADGLKLIMKEDLIPAEADSILFRASPYLAFVGLFLVFMVIPFTGWLIVADLNIGLLFILSVTSLVVVSIIMGGWSSNSKWSLLGGMRSAAQIISYELPASVALLSIATITGSLSTETIVRAQGGAPWNWNLFRSPFTFVACFIYFVSALAEGNRTPFDLPEAESELVSGFNTEYSGFRFSLFPLVEWVNLFVIGAVVSLLFLGGWRVPLLSSQHQDASGLLQALGFGVFLVKIIAIIFVIIWIRWTLPRFRVDQMMNLCWKYFIPISFVCFIGTLAYTWLLPASVQYFSRYVWFAALGLGPAFLFLQRVRYNRGKYIPLNLNPSL